MNSDDAELQVYLRATDTLNVSAFPGRRTHDARTKTKKCNTYNVTHLGLATEEPGPGFGDQQAANVCYAYDSFSCPERQ